MGLGRIADRGFGDPESVSIIISISQAGMRERDSNAQGLTQV